MGNHPEAKLDLDSPIESAKGVGLKTAPLLKRAGITTLGDLLYFLPRVYEDYQATVNIADLKPGKIIIRGKISDLKTRRTARRNLTITEGVIRDDSGAIRTVWFNQPYRAKQFDPSKEYFFTGQYEFKSGRYQLTSPAATLATEVGTTIFNNSGGFKPVYSSKYSLKPSTFQKLLQNLKPDFQKIPDLLPMGNACPDFVKPGARAEAFYNSHFPENSAIADQAHQYLAYEELFELILAAKLNKMENQRLNATKLPFNADFVRQIVKQLPFKMTDAQRRSTWEILQDLEKNRPMNRLLQGDVGAGKTIVAAIAAAQVAYHGGQVALLAPTAILATQHYEDFCKLFAKIKIPTEDGKTRPLKIALLIGATKQKSTIKEQIANKEIDLVIGTHALLTDDTNFHNLVFCIIDEQHRFGVNQRQKLLLKSPTNLAPHLLMMTATPIPRSLQLTVFGDLNTSILDQLPPGRQPTTTKILSEIEQHDSLYPEMRKILATGQQIYWICQAIDENNSINTNQPTSGNNSLSVSSAQNTNVTAVKTQFKKLQKLFPKYQIGLLHGKMKPAEKDAVMADFANNKVQILVSTTVVEVGVNVPNANLMVIQDADGYGLAQLHQLRGRVGRGNQPAQCFLLIKTEKPSRRLKVLEKSTDGFYLAEVDLKLRGPGEIYGAMQHGELNLRIASLSDSTLIRQASHHASEIARRPEVLQDYPELLKRIQKYQQLTILN